MARSWPSYRRRNKFSCKANVDYPTVNVPGNYISREEADCYCCCLRPSTHPFPALFPPLTCLLSLPLYHSLSPSLFLSLTYSLFISLALYLGLVINYTDKLGPPAGFSSILYELVPFHPVSFCPAPRHFWFMRAHLRSLSTTGELTSPVSVVCERRL